MFDDAYSSPDVLATRRGTPKRSRSPRYRRSWLAAAALGLIGCAAEAVPERAAEGDDGVAAPSSQRVDLAGFAGAGAIAPEAEEGEVQAQTQALIACNPTPSHRHGGDAFSASYPVELGCACGTGFVRDRFTVWNTGHGSCSAIGWATTDRRDCTVRVQINRSGGFANGECFARVEKRNDPNSCRVSCDRQAPGGCWCDDSCTAFGDCCSDYRTWCD
jgi:hypothetical protein